MKFVHIADMHFDTPFRVLTNRADLGDTRRLDQRKVFRKIIEYIKQNKIEHLFIAGDFYDHDHVKQSTIEFINNLFKQIPDTKIYITPGNHDPYISNSFYNKYLWNDNVFIFTPEISVIETEEVNIFGCGFGDFYYSNPEIEKIKIKEKNKINVLITHGTLNGAATMERDYNPLSKKAIEDIGFDYVALGHIHKTNYSKSENQKVIYPGSTISMGFDELGSHGIIVGEIEINQSENKQKQTKIDFITVDDKEFKIKTLDVTEISSMEELVESINEIIIPENEYYEVELIGRRKFDVNKNALIKLIHNLNIIKIKDQTKCGYEIEKLVNENTLKGLFANEVLELLKKGEIEKQLLEEVFEIGYEVLEK